jgi:hypothetical protein
VPASNVYLLGGPCDGRTVSADQIVGGLTAYIKCGGGYYVLDDGVTRPNGDVVFKYSGTTQPRPPGPGAVKAPRAHKGWQAMRVSFNHKMPDGLHASQRSTDAALRMLQRVRKVRL